MTSFEADNIVSMQVFCPTFTIQGQIYHTIGSLLPATNTQPKFLQVYFMGDKEAQVNRRSEYVQGVERNTVQKIQVLHDHNILVHEFKMAKDRVTSDNYKVVMLSLEHMLKTPRNWQRPSRHRPRRHGSFHTPILSRCGVGRRTHRSSFSEYATTYSRRKMVV
ncbi:helitron_like_N domain-containing protein [Trichonephila clavipes]|nr:helitron_like_N domain-containing protein [Trichonephila clavipes]